MVGLKLRVAHHKDSGPREAGPRTRKALSGARLAPITQERGGSHDRCRLDRNTRATPCRCGRQRRGEPAMGRAPREAPAELAVRAGGRGVPPQGAPPPAEIASLYASWINEVAYASIEAPRVHGEGADFDIHYCPHEDVYGAFDCRVQRYFVEGMIAAARRSFGEGIFDVSFASTIPSGSSTCHFDLFPKQTGANDAWNDY